MEESVTRGVAPVPQALLPTGDAGGVGAKTASVSLVPSMTMKESKGPVAREAGEYAVQAAGTLMQGTCEREGSHRPALWRAVISAAASNLPPA